MIKVGEKFMCKDCGDVITQYKEFVYGGLCRSCAEHKYTPDVDEEYDDAV